MKHLNEAELIEHYYDESASAADCERHLKVCSACAKHFADLRRDLDGVKPLDPPVRGERLRGTSLAIDSRLVAGIRETGPELDPALASAWLGSRLRSPDCRGLCCRTPVGAEADAVSCRGS